MPRGYEEDEARRRERDRYRGENVPDDPWMRREGQRQTYDAEPRYDLAGGSDVGGGRDGGSAYDELDQWVRDTEGIPLIGGPADARAAEARAQDAEARNRQPWINIAREAPGVDDLTTRYYLEGTEDAYGDLLGDPSQLEGFDSRGTGHQQAAMTALQQMMGTAPTSGELEVARQQRRLGAMERGQQLRGANEAALQQMSARGMGGSGAELAARLSASQGLSQGQAMSDAASGAALQQQALQRAMAAMSGYQSGANALAAQDLARRNALDSFNQGNMDWRRGQETRNTAWANRGQESATQARQQVHDNAERAAAGMTGQYSTDVSRRQNEGARRDRQNEQALGAVGGILSELF